MNRELAEIFKQSVNDNAIENGLYKTYEVKKGLRNEDSTGVLVGLTKIADVVGYKRVNGEKVDDIGRLYYRGYEIKDLIDGLDFSEHHAFEEVAFLILFGKLPNASELALFMSYLQSHYALPKDFLELNILRMPGKNLMNTVQQAILMLYGYDENSDDTTAMNTLFQGLNIIAKMPAIISYSYQAKRHNFDDESLIIHQIDPHCTISESILRLIRSDMQYTDTEVRVLDCMLILHTDHGGGNNSTFTNVVISSTGTDIYSAISGSIGSLKGPRHGGASLAVCQMMSAVIDEIGYQADDAAIRDIVERLLDKDFFDHSGLIYGIGHAVYTLSDPRSEILKEKAYMLAEEKQMIEQFDFYKRFEEIAKQCIKERKGKSVSSNIDFYSGFVYSMLNIPQELVSLLFVTARIVGWLAHNIEDKCYCDKIVRPATKYVGDTKKFVKIEER